MRSAYTMTLTGRLLNFRGASLTYMDPWKQRTC